MKLPNGYGSIYKRKAKNLRKPFVARTPATANLVTGAMERKVIGNYATRKEAIQALLDYQTNPKVIGKDKITLEQVYRNWKNIKYRNISKQTKDNYEASWLKLAEIKDYPISEIRTAELQQIVDNTHQSLSSLKKLKSVATMIWEFAEQDDIVNKNYAKFIVLPKEKPTEKLHFTEIQLQEVKRLAEKGDIRAESVLALCYTGFRINEFLSLTIPFSLITNNENKVIAFRGGSKTEAGKDRIVPISSKIRPYIDKWIKKDNPYLFAMEDGRKMKPDYYRRYLFNPLMDELGYKNLTPHSCRHTFFTLCDRAELTDATTQKIGGHSNLKTTHHYTHKEMTDLLQAVEKL